MAYRRAAPWDTSCILWQVLGTPLRPPLSRAKNESKASDLLNFLPARGRDSRPLPIYPDRFRFWTKYVLHAAHLPEEVQAHVGAMIMTSAEDWGHAGMEQGVQSGD